MARRTASGSCPMRLRTIWTKRIRTPPGRGVIDLNDTDHPVSESHNAKLAGTRQTRPPCRPRFRVPETFRTPRIRSITLDGRARIPMRGRGDGLTKPSDMHPN